jgi:ferredoxin
MQIKVDRDLCEANGVCCGLAPDVFELDDDEMLVVKVEDVPSAALDRVNQAAARCPKGALQVAS